MFPSTTHPGSCLAPTFALVTVGSVAIEPDAGDGQTRALDADETALVASDLGVGGAAEDGARFVAAVIGADIGAAEGEADSHFTRVDDDRAGLRPVD